MSSYTHLSFALAAAFSIVCLSTSHTEALNNGFGVELFHRDSAKSPFFNRTETPYQKIVNAIKRSMNRANHFYPSISKDSAQSEVSPNRGEYLMTYSVGTPPFEVLGIADTGSDLIWMQCNPCPKCYDQKAPLFDPSNSTSYRNIPCFSRQCQSLDQTSCSSNGRRKCQYSYSYGDQSYTNGDVASETITLGSTSGRAVSLPRIIIGCGHNNDGTFDSKGSGIVGLGGGAISLITQMGSSIGGKFSYCLIPIFSDSNVASKMNFGEKAVVSGAGSVSTPMVSKQPDTFYYLTLEGFTVGHRRLDFVSEKVAGKNEGNIIIDSGTTLTLLPEDFYDTLEAEVEEQIKATRVPSPDEFLSLCYSSTSKSFRAPIITAHFRGADVKLNPVNTFLKVSDDVVCFSFASMPNGAIYGNLAQMNFLVGYDLQKRTVSFKPTDCTRV